MKEVRARRRAERAVAADRAAAAETAAESSMEQSTERAEQWLNEQLARDGAPDQDEFGGWGNVCFGNESPSQAGPPAHQASPPPPGDDPPIGLPRGVSQY